MSRFSNMSIEQLKALGIEIEEAVDESKLLEDEDGNLVDSNGEIVTYYEDRTDIEFEDDDEDVGEDIGEEDEEDIDLDDMDFGKIKLNKPNEIKQEVIENHAESEEIYDEEYGEEYDEEYEDGYEIDDLNDMPLEDLEKLLADMKKDEEETKKNTEEETPEKVIEQMNNVGLSESERDTETLFDSTGNPIQLKLNGTLSIEILKLDDIFIPPRTRKNDKEDMIELEKSIQQWGLIEPLHVIPYKDKYIIVSGVRRYIAMRNLRMEEAPCIIDTTRKKDIIRYLEVISNGIRRYKFVELMDFGAYIEKKQPVLKSEVIENILGMEAGDYLKAKYIQTMDEFGVLAEVILGKKSIKEGFKKIEKELAKLDKEKLEQAEKNIEANPDGTYDYNSLQLEKPNEQTTKDRQPLPRHLVDRIRARDGHTCQSCGLGFYQPELTSVFETHHVVPVHNKGNDDDNNLLTICSNCHKIIHSYADNKFNPPENRLSHYTNVILLGNIIKNGLPEGRKAYEFFMSNAEQPWLEN